MPHSMSVVDTRNDCFHEHSDYHSQSCALGEITFPHLLGVIAVTSARIFLIPIMFMTRTDDLFYEDP